MPQPESDFPDSPSPALRLGMIAVILAPAVGIPVMHYLAYRAGGGAEVFPPDWFKLCAVEVLSLFLPLLAYSYYFFRKQRREVAVDRIITTLRIEEDEYVRMFRRIHSGPYYLIAVGMAWLIALAGLMVLFFGDLVWAFDGPESAGAGFPKPGSRLVFGMAFLGAYVWGLQYVLRRYVLNDLIPGAFFKLSIRMLMASVLVLVIFNGYASLAGEGAQEFSNSAWPGMAFLLGAFPQRCLNWLASRIPILSEQPDPSVRRLPLEMLEGIDSYDRMRLEEVGIDDCYDLASYDFVPLMLKTSYDARKLADWILQAKFCVQCGEAVGVLRQQGIRGIHELAELSGEEIESLANETPATLFSLKRAHQAAIKDPEIRRLQGVAGQLSRYTRSDAVSGSTPA